MVKNICDYYDILYDMIEEEQNNLKKKKLIVNINDNIMIVEHVY